MSKKLWAHLAPLKAPIPSFIAGAMTARLATAVDMPNLYMLGFDAWGHLSTPADYLSVCAASSKYKLGNWYSFTDTKSSVAPCVSLICYDLSIFFGRPVLGVGSIATCRSVRRHGLCAQALSALIKTYSSNTAFERFLLFADSTTSSYRNVGFRGVSNATSSPLMHHGADTDQDTALERKLFTLPYF